MDLSSKKVTDADRLALCKKYFGLGFLCLPFLWAVNAVWFYPWAFKRTPEYPEQKTLKRLVVASAIGASIYLVAFVTWVCVFSAKRAEWGAFADSISFNIPTGTA